MSPMTALWVAWPVSTVALVLLYVWAGSATPGRVGVLVDTRGRYSLSRFQLALWTLVILPLIAGVFVGRAFLRGTDPFEFSVPPQVIALLGLSVATTAVATGVKTVKDRTRAEYVAASGPGDAKLRQMVLVEEGPDTDTVDFTKLQQLALTVLLACGYVAICLHTFLGAGLQVITSADQITALPGLDTTFVTLLGLSQLGYLAGKVPARGGALVTAADASLPDASAQRVLAAPAYSLRDKLLGVPPPTTASNSRALARTILLHAHDRRTQAAGTNTSGNQSGDEAGSEDEKVPPAQAGKSS